METKEGGLRLTWKVPSNGLARNSALSKLVERSNLAIARVKTCFEVVEEIGP